MKTKNPIGGLMEVRDLRPGDRVWPVNADCDGPDRIRLKRIVDKVEPSAVNQDKLKIIYRLKPAFMPGAALQFVDVLFRDDIVWVDRPERDTV